MTDLGIECHIDWHFGKHVFFGPAWDLRGKWEDANGYQREHGSHTCQTFAEDEALRKLSMASYVEELATKHHGQNSLPVRDVAEGMLVHDKAINRHEVMRVFK